MLEEHESQLHSAPPQDPIQVVLTSSKENLPYGDLLQTAKQKNTIRIFFQNVNGIYKFKSWSSLKQATHHLKEMSIDVIGLAETNLHWNTRTTNAARNIFQKTFKTVQLNVSNNKDPSRSTFQPGGTLTAITNRFTGYITGTVEDPSNMGRWSGFTLSTNFQTEIHILTVYQSVVSDGIHSTYRKQHHQLLLMGDKNPNPRKKLIEDLETIIEKWNNKGDKTIILIDANDNIFLKNSLLPKFLANTKLTSLIPYPLQHPATHARGTKCIDYIFGSSSIVNKASR
jgi:hypothetical protein